jgi:aspartyl-tRNA synthetase
VLKDIGCGELRADDGGRRVRLAGWVHRRRDHGGLIFIDLRDVTGLIQVVFDPASAPGAHRAAEGARSEFVLAITGTLRPRPAGTENAALPTGAVEVLAEECEILNEARTPPFYINEDVEVDESLRMRYRYLYLRRPAVQSKLILRHRMVKAIRDFLDARGFYEIETPMLVQSSPGGAREFLVPSRLHPGQFYALPQSPQQMKQLLMVAGYERYFQIARCFRDEDPRADRLTEFTQLDLEMSFVEQDDVIALTEELLILLARDFAPHLRVRQVPFPRLTFAEAMERYGSDKPDLRFAMELVDIQDLAEQTEFNVFKQALASGGVVKGLAVPGGAAFSRREIDALTEFAREFGARGLAWVALGSADASGSVADLPDDAIRSPIAKFVPRPVLDEIAGRMGADAGDLLLFVADSRPVAREVLGRLRARLGPQLGLADPNELAFCWVDEFPLFEWKPEANGWVAMHHMFTAPLDEDLQYLETDPGRVRAKAYDIVCNGMEIAGGSIRIHQRDLQQRVFDVMGYDEAAVRAQFGALLDAFQYGAPPHGGIAPGIDRLVMKFTQEENIREVIAFPKTAMATDPMLGAPSPATPEQLADLHISIAADPREAPAAGATIA